VASTAQRLGVGRKLLSALIKESKQRQIRELFALSASPTFFLNLGFTIQHRGRYPFKESSDCMNCSWFSDCRETAVALEIQADMGLWLPCNTNIHMEDSRSAADEMV
jgi:N-acetylglutamate synthase-like GNAT family acetyltransferase